eukprot:TRINITY_DN122232_c0_g1_i1.p1 TRINITY_DN122232_c0_g1~~TRINITY_DN122232_c0_g1_i1.p1  ORF type:complete len:760 (+),score=245.08 TRINITY_DN122232_c0_g1_i1:38-2317(+)
MSHPAEHFPLSRQSVSHGVFPQPFLLKREVQYLVEGHPEGGRLSPAATTLLRGRFCSLKAAAGTVRLRLPLQYSQTFGQSRAWYVRTPSCAMSASAKKDAKSKKDDKKKEEKKAVISLEPPSGTRDFFPEDYRLQRWLFDKFREVGSLYGFQEYDAPVLENEELYKRKAGEEITQQMYNFEDKEGAKVTLRPEMTPTLARMVLSLMRAETGEMAALLPLKWFSIPQCWRFETTQRGRKREHYQWNMDIVGVPGITAEVELLAAICTFFEKIGITSQDVGLKINSRKVLGAVLKKAGVPDDRFAETCVIIDKQDKIGADEVCKELKEKVGLSDAVSKKIVSATTAKTVDEFASLAGVGDSEEVKELRTLFQLLEEYGFGDWIQFDASVVRGLAYYTGVVFEGFDKAGALRAICGGGRYDRLLTLYGSPKEVPCVGFGFGDCVVVELLKEKGVMPVLPNQVEYVVAAFNADMMGKAMNVARRLRLVGKTVDVFQEPAKKVAKAFNYADRCGAHRVAFVAPSEWEAGKVRIKDLRNFGKDASDDDKQKDVPLDDLANIDSYFGGISTAAAGLRVAAAPAPAAASTAAPAVASKAAPAAAAGGVDEAAVKAIGDQLRVLKEKLKSDGVSGKKLNDHPEVKALVDKLTQLKSGGSAPAAAPAASKAAASPKKEAAKAKAAPAAAKAASAPAAAKPAAASKQMSDKQLEEWFLDHPYLGGFRPSAADRELFDKLSTSSGKPATPAYGRWYSHVGSFKTLQRQEWK